MQNKTKLEITEVKYIRSSSRKNNEQKRINRVQRIVSTAVVLVCIAFLVLGGINVVAANTSAYQITVDGETVATMTSRREAQSILDLFLDERSDEMGVAAVSGNRVDIVRISARDAVYTSSSDALVALDEYMHVLAQATAILVEGVPVLYVADIYAARQALDALQDHFAGPDGTARVVQQVRAESASVLPEQVLTAEDAANLLIFGDADVEYYFVQSEDESFASIARGFGFSPEEIEAANPLLDVDDVEYELPFGAVIRLAAVEPLISVQVTRTVVMIEEIPYDTEYRENHQVARGTETVLTYGTPGQAEVTLEIIEHNGEIIDQIQIASIVIEAPVYQVVERGAAWEGRVASRAAPLAGTLPTNDGFVGNPFPAGNISSRFGPRRGGFHTGLDIAGPTGSPLAAAEAGEVIFTGWSGGYGLTVRIYHGNGMETLYGHLSQIFVEEGELVERGQNIGAVGSTGRSTGPHVHFEIRFDGIAVDPLLYIVH